MTNGNIMGGGVSGCLVRVLRAGNVPARFIGRLSSHRATIGGISVIPLRIVVHGHTTNSVYGELNLRRNVSFITPSVRFSCGYSRLSSPLVSRCRTVSYNFTAERRMSAVGSVTFGVGSILGRCFTSVNIRLVSFGLRFNGASSNAVILTSRVDPSAYHF